MSRKFLAMCLMFIVASSVIYEAQGTFLLKMYLRRRLGRRCVDFTHYAFKGMLMFVGSLEGGCPATREFKNFFAQFKTYMTFINSVSVSSSSNIDVEVNGQADSLFKACSALDVDKSSSTESFRSSMLSMGKTLIEQKRRGSMIMTISQKRELLKAMVEWTRMVATFVKTASEQRGKSIDISSYGLDVDINKSIKSSGSIDTQSAPSTGTGTYKSGGVSVGSESTTKGANEGSVTSNTKTRETTGGTTSTKTGAVGTYSDTTGSASPTGSPTGTSPATGSPTGTSPATGSPTGTSPATGNASYKSKKAGGETTFTDTTGKTSGSSPTGSPGAGSSTSQGVTSKTKQTGGQSTFADTTGKSSGSPSGSPTGESSTTQTGTSNTKKTSGGSTFADTTGTTSGSPTGSPTTKDATSTSVGAKTTVGGASATSGSIASKSTGASTFSDTTGAKSVTPTASPSTVSGGADTSMGTATTSKGSTTTGTTTAMSSSSTTSVKQVETETSSEVMSFISNLEKKYSEKTELKVFFDKLKTSMSASAKLSSTNTQEVDSGMRTATGKLSEAMGFVRSRFGKTAETKTSMETCQEQVMKSLKELQDIKSEIVTQGQGKTVTSTQKTELKQTLTKWEQVTTQFVETAASSTSSSSSSSSTHQQQNSAMTTQVAAQAS